jgi:hypothetical protein
LFNPIAICVLPGRVVTFISLATLMLFSADGMPLQLRSSAALESERSYDELQETIDFGDNYDLGY